MATAESDEAKQPAPSGTRIAQPARLSASQLLALQLAARGYTPRQIALLTNAPPGGVTELLAAAARLLRAEDVPAAIAIAIRRGLIS